MTDFHIDATARTPKISLDGAASTMLIAGESYPEDVTIFYNQLTDALNQHFATSPKALKVEIKLTYFNSSSARALMELLDLLDEQAEGGIAVTVDWYCDPDDDITREFAEDIAADIEAITVTLHDLDADEG